MAEKLSFEEAIEKLQACVKKLEAGGFTYRDDVRPQ